MVSEDVRVYFLETGSHFCIPNDLPACAQSGVIIDVRHQERLHFPNPKILKTYSCECSACVYECALPGVSEGRKKELRL